MVDNIATNNSISALGLTENEFSVYSAFLKYGESSAANIARTIKMDKSSAYRATENLERLGLLIKNYKDRGTTYKATSPDVLSELYESKKSQLDLVIEDLKKQSINSARSTYITVGSGLHSLQLNMNKSLDSTEKLIREKFSNKFRYFNDKNHVKFINNYAKERTKRGIKIIQLEDSDWNPEGPFKEIMTETQKYLKEVRKLPGDAKLGENSLRIWDDTINIISEDEFGEFIIITIKDKLVVKLMKDMYDFMWNRSEII